MEYKRYFGLHFDFHASDEDVIGVRTSPEDIEWYIEQARPDYVQCDCKGHPGNCSYPTKVGKAAKNLKTDNLKIWCDTVHKHGLPIFMHYSGLWDKAQAKLHPEYAIVDANGEITEIMSPFGKYVDEILIPQFKEMIREYQIDGMWVDGDCWALRRDFSEKAKPFLWEGITKREHYMVMREAFLRYVDKYAKELHAYAPGFKVASNWAFTAYIPEKPCVDVDFLSGDYVQNDSVHAVRYESRCMASQNMPWDLMSWSFEIKRWTDKPAVQLMQEAAMVLMLGGGFQLYITQNRDGSARRYRDNRLKIVGDFMEERRFLFEKKPVAQIGVLFSTDSYYHDSSMFNASGCTEALIGVLNCILDGQYTAGIVFEYQLDEIEKYDSLVIPEWKYISDANKEKLLKYAENGGNLVIIGTKCCLQFSELTGKGFRMVREEESAQLNENDNRGTYEWILGDDGLFTGTICDIVDLGEGEGYLYSNHDLRDADVPAYRVDEYGSGKILFIPFDLGTTYFDGRTYNMVNYLKKVLRNAAEPMIEINRKNIDISMQEDGDGFLVNLVNMYQGRHSLNIVVYDEIPPIYGVDVVIHGTYQNVTMPLGESFTCEYGTDFVKIHMEHLDIHSVIRVS